MIKRRSTKTRWMVILGTIVALTLVNILFGLAWPPLLTKAGPTLPPRQPSNGPDNDKDGDKPVGASIELHVQFAPVEAWTVVQWRDSAGNWHDVEGWQGALDQGGQKVWWVAKTDLGKGPFRWIVYEGQGGKVLAESEAFYLPHQSNMIIRIEVVIRL